MTGIFIKIGREEHLKRFRNEGMLHCETLDFFAEIEDGRRRGDKMENATKFFNKSNHVLTIFDENDKSKNMKINLVKAHFSEKNQAINLFCLYKVDINEYEENKPFMLEQKFCEEAWGSHFVIITQPENFIKQLEKKVNNLNLAMISDVVRYKDLANYKGDNDGFIKDESYSYQKEFRIKIKNNEAKCIDIFIGDISNITLPLYSLDTFKTLKMYYKKAEDLSI